MEGPFRSYAGWEVSMDEGRSSIPRDRMHAGAVSMEFAATSSTRLQGRMASMKMVPIPMAGAGQTAHQVDREFGHASVTGRAIQGMSLNATVGKTK